jgi:hypothetical protein
MDAGILGRNAREKRWCYLGTVKLTDFTMQLLQSVGSKSLIVRCGVGMFHPSKDEIYVNLTVPIKSIIEPYRVLNDFSGKSISFVHF